MEGLVEGGCGFVDFAAAEADLAEGVEYAKAKQAEGSAPASSAIYGGVAGGMTAEADEFIRLIMADMMDRQQAVSPAPGA